VIPKLIRLQQVMISAAVSRENSDLPSKTPIPSMSFPYAPIILLTLKRIVSIVYQMDSRDLLAELVIKVCEMNVSILFDDPIEGSMIGEEERGGNLSLSASKIPFAPLLWKESLVDLTKEIFRSELLRLYPPLRDLYFPNLSSHGAPVEKPASYHFSMSDLLQLIHHPISEVREGVILGCLNSLTDLTELEESQLSSEQLPSKPALVHSFLALASGDSKFNKGQSFLTILFRRITTETEPPILQITLQLILMSVSCWPSSASSRLIIFVLASHCGLLSPLLTMKPKRIA
jgi:hypothetical protein